MQKADNTLPRPAKPTRDQLLNIYGKYALFAFLIVFGFILANTALEYLGIVLALTFAFVDTLPKNR